MLCQEESLRESGLQKIGGIKMLKLFATGFLLISLATESIGGCAGRDGDVNQDGSVKVREFTKWG